MHPVLAFFLSHNQGLPSLILVEFDYGAVSVGVGDHIVVTRTHGSVVPYVSGRHKLKSFGNGCATVQEQSHQNGCSDGVLAGVLLRCLMRKGHYGRAEAFFVHSVNGCIYRCDAEQLALEVLGEFLETVPEMGHVAACY